MWPDLSYQRGVTSNTQEECQSGDIDHTKEQGRVGGTWPLKTQDCQIPSRLTEANVFHKCWRQLQHEFFICTYQHPKTVCMVLCRAVSWFFFYPTLFNKHKVQIMLGRYQISHHHQKGHKRDNIPPEGKVISSWVVFWKLKYSPKWLNEESKVPFKISKLRYFCSPDVGAFCHLGPLCRVT